MKYSFLKIYQSRDEPVPTPQSAEDQSTTLYYDIKAIVERHNGLFPYELDHPDIAFGIVDRSGLIFSFSLNEETGTYSVKEMTVNATPYPDVKTLLEDQIIGDYKAFSKALSKKLSGYQNEISLRVA